MVDEKITDYTALTGASLATGDLFEMVDVSDTSMDATGTNKKMTAAELATGIATVKPPSRSVSDTHTDTTAVNTTSQTVLASQAIPTTAAAGDVFRLIAHGEVTNSSGSAVVFTFAAIIGGTTFSASGLSLGTGAQNRSWRAEVEVVVVAPGASSPDERVTVWFHLANAGGTPLIVSGTNTLGVSIGTAAEDLTAGKNVQWAVTMGTANANASVVCHANWLEAVKR